MSENYPVTNEINASPKANILIVDDHSIVLDGLQAILVQDGYRVSKAFDGLDALRQVEIKLPDVIVVDLTMPRMDGIEMIEQLKQGYSTRGIPIVVLTMHSSAEYRSRAFDAGVNDYVHKEQAGSVLLRVINRALSSSDSVSNSQSINGVNLPGRKATERRLTELLFEDNWTVLLVRLDEGTSVRQASEFLARGTRANFAGLWDVRGGMEFALIANPELAAFEHEWLERIFPECSIGMVSGKSVGSFAEAEDIIAAARKNIGREE